MLTQELLKRLLDYNQETGALTWKVARSSKSKVGQVAGYINNDGFWATSIQNKLYKNHYLVWLWHHGELPETRIIHANKDCLDNRIENLIVSPLKKSPGPEDKSYRGVTASKLFKKWVAFFRLPEQELYLGLYSDIVDAAQAYNLAAEMFGGPKVKFNGSPNSKAFKIFF
jgi:hypothetical protein